MPTPSSVHLTCAALVAADLVARSWRTQLLVHGVGHQLSFTRSFAINSFGDAAATLTPLRLAGQPARVLALVHDGVPLDATLVALGVEAVITYATVAICAILLVVGALPDWQHTLGRATADAGGTIGPWLLAGVLLVAGAWFAASRLAARRRRRGALRAADGAAADGAAADGAAADGGERPSPLRRLSAMWSLLASVPLRAALLAIPLSIVNVMARVALLPVLAQLLPTPPAWGAAWLGSFALLYGQLVVPTPAGAGIVDAGFLAGAQAAGDTAAAGTLLWWRLYSSGVGLVLGLVLGAPRYGVRPVIRAVRDGLRRSGVARSARQ